MPRLFVLAVLAASSGLTLLAGCDAPHDNPLDPASAAYRNEGVVGGRVTGLYPPFEGRAGVQVHLVPLAGAAPTGAPIVEARTGADGRFEVSVPSGRYAVFTDHPAYERAADTVEVAVGRPVEVALALNALPVVTAQAVRTVHVEQWSTAPIFRLEVEAEATDPDQPGDLASAALVVEALGFRAPLVQTAPGHFAVAFDAAALPDGLVQSLLGQTLRIEVVDRSGTAALGPPLALVRVIEQTPLTASPQGYVFVAENPPALVWQPSALPFPFTYRVELSLVDGAGQPNLVHDANGISSGTTVHALPGPLAPGDYVWAVWTVDGAGNRSRSKAAGFRVP